MRVRPVRPARVAFVTALVSGAAMIGASVHGMLGIDHRLEQSAQASQRAAAPHVVRVRAVDCAPPRASRI
jgi:hypothetical protein